MELKTVKIDIPEGLNIIIGQSHFVKTVEDMYLAMKSRLAGAADGGTGRRLIAGRIFFIFKKSQLRYEETYRAMVSRGFTGDIELYGGRELTARDVAAGIVLGAAGAVFIVMQVVL